MGRIAQRTRIRRWLALLSALAIVGAMLAIPASNVAADEPSDMVLVWNANAVSIISSPAAQPLPPAPPVPFLGLGQGPPPSALHLAMVHGAIYDAVNAIAGTHEPYLANLPAVPSPISTAAAVVGAAHHVLWGLTPATSLEVQARLTAMRTASTDLIPNGAAEDNGLAFGAAVGQRMLDARANDGRFPAVPVLWIQGFDTGEWRQVPTANLNQVAWVKDVTPFVMKSTSQFRTAGPLDMTSAQYAAEFNEVKFKGAKVNSTRTTEEDRIASFVSANPLPYQNAGIRSVAAAKGLSTTQQARLFAMTSMSSADALIGCWDDKEFWSFWRPTTAIHNAADDENPATMPNGAWEALYTVPGYPDHPSGYNCFTAGMMHAARLFFGTDKVSFTLTSPGTAPLTNIARQYTRFTGVVDDTIDGRILTGFHFRSSDVQGAWIGKKVAQWTEKHFFEPLD